MSNYPYNNWGRDPYHNPTHYSGPPQGTPQGPPPGPPQGPPHYSVPPQGPPQGTPSGPPAVAPVPGAHPHPTHYSGPPQGPPSGPPAVAPYVPPSHHSVSGSHSTVPHGQSQGPTSHHSYIPPQGPSSYNVPPYNATYPNYSSYPPSSYNPHAHYNYGSNPTYPAPVSTNSTIASGYVDNQSTNSSVSSKSNKEKEKYRNDHKKSKHTEQREKIKTSIRYLLHTIDQFYRDEVGNNFIKTYLNDFIKFCMSGEYHYKDDNVRDSISTFLKRCMPDITPSTEFYPIIVEGIYCNLEYFATDYHYVIRNFDPKKMIVKILDENKIVDENKNLDYEEALREKFPNKEENKSVHSTGDVRPANKQGESPNKSVHSLTNQSSQSEWKQQPSSGWESSKPDSNRTSSWGDKKNNSDNHSHSSWNNNNNNVPKKSSWENNHFDHDPPSWNAKNYFYNQSEGEKRFNDFRKSNSHYEPLYPDHDRPRNRGYFGGYRKSLACRGGRGGRGTRKWSNPNYRDRYDPDHYRNRERDQERDRDQEFDRKKDNYD